MKKTRVFFLRIFSVMKSSKKPRCSSLSLLWISLSLSAVYSYWSLNTRYDFFNREWDQIDRRVKVTGVAMIPFDISHVFSFNTVFPQLDRCKHNKSIAQSWWTVVEIIIIITTGCVAHENTGYVDANGEATSKSLLGLFIVAEHFYSLLSQMIYFSLASVLQTDRRRPSAVFPSSRYSLRFRPSRTSPR